MERVMEGYDDRDDMIDEIEQEIGKSINFTLLKTIALRKTGISISN